jgi:hypothetical protein
VRAQTAREDQLDAMQELGLTPSFFSLHPCRRQRREGARSRDHAADALSMRRG